MKVLITGAAGFIGFSLGQDMVRYGHEVIGIDNFNDYYDVRLKYARKSKANFEIYSCDLLNYLTHPLKLEEVFRNNEFDLVIHLAAYAGVRHSMEKPNQYIQTNIQGTQNLIDLCEKYNVKKVIYASTSCVMAGQELPWREEPATFKQKNPYGFSKRTNECQFEISKIPVTVGLRFFTVYGPWGRPDMALFEFTDRIKKDIPIKAFNYGNMKRDFTYIDDIVQGISCVVRTQFPEGTNEIFNIGNGRQVDLMDFIKLIGKNLGKKPRIILAPPHPADTLETWSDTTKLQKLGYKSSTPIEKGVEKFIDWYHWWDNTK